MKDDTEDPRPPCMACDAGKMEYTGYIITTPTGIPTMKCNVCGTTAEVTFPFGTKRIIHMSSPATEMPTPLWGQRREIIFLDEAGDLAEPDDETRALFEAVMGEYEKKT